MPKKAQMTLAFVVMIQMTFVGLGILAAQNHREAMAKNAESRLQHDLAIRREQARELLGEASERHIAEAAEEVRASELVRELVRKSWKGNAGDVERVTFAVMEESRRHLLDPIFLLAVIQRESRFQPTARGRHGEIGLMQLKPSTGEWIASKYRYPWLGAESLEDPIVNIRLGAAYLDFLRKKFRSAGGLYLAAYNLGPKKTRQMLNENLVPRLYADEVITNYVRFYAEAKEMSGSNG